MADGYQPNFLANGIVVHNSGKTTTIVEAARHLPTSLSCAFVAFNKSIADELKLRLPAHVRAQTLNSLGFGAWRRHIGERAASLLRLDANKVRQITQDVIPDQYYGLLSKGMPRLIGIAKSAGIVPNTLLGADGICTYSGLVEENDSTWPELVETYGIDMEADIDKPGDAELISQYARAILAQSIRVADHLIDFDDQLYMPVITGARFWQNDLIFVDEAQDVSRIQRVMIRRALKPRGRLIAVGDPNQAIYAFRGADSSSIEMIKREFHARELPLTISYRCPKSVVAEARQFVSHIQPADSAKDGLVRTLGKFDAQLFQNTDVIICRNTRPLIDMAFNLLRDSVACKVRGRDIGAGLVALVKRFKTGDLSIFQQKFDSYVASKTADYLRRQKDELAARLQDQYDTVTIFIDSLDAGATVLDLVAKIESLFTDNGPGVLTLSTIHKYKGEEADRVFILDADLMPSRYARTPEAKQQERNLQYVAITRARSELAYILGRNFKPGKPGKEKASKQQSNLQSSLGGAQ